MKNAFTGYFRKLAHLAPCFSCALPGHVKNMITRRFPRYGGLSAGVGWQRSALLAALGLGLYPACLADRAGEVSSTRVSCHGRERAEVPPPGGHDLGLGLHDDGPALAPRRSLLPLRLRPRLCRGRGSAGTRRWTRPCSPSSRPSSRHAGERSYLDTVRKKNAWQLRGVTGAPGGGGPPEVLGRRGAAAAAPGAPDTHALTCRT